MRRVKLALHLPFLPSFDSLLIVNRVYPCVCETRRIKVIIQSDSDKSPLKRVKLLEAKKLMGNMLIAIANNKAIVKIFDEGSLRTNAQKSEDKQLQQVNRTPTRDSREHYNRLRWR